MNLVEWANISENQRHQLVVEWHKNWSNSDWDYLDLAEEAAQAFEKELKAIPEVRHVRVAAGETIGSLDSVTPIHMFILNVWISLPESQRLEKLPTWFAGFRVEQFSFGDQRDAFLATLKCCFKQLKGWNETETMNWVKNWGQNSSREENRLIDALEGGELAGPFYSHGPVKTAIEAILDQQTRKAVEAAGNNHIKLRNDLISVIEDSVRKTGSEEYVHPDRINNFDWLTVKKKIEAIIENYCRVKQ